ncbi:hypothetical protein [Tepidimonas sp.]|uniref:hypothetical protein n=1 Tax=Tepidimonas sp. TaxID=2002775 RepID=UPI003919A4D9
MIGHAAPIVNPSRRIERSQPVPITVARIAPEAGDSLRCTRVFLKGPINTPHPGCERIVRYAFGYARRHGRKKVTCRTKDHTMKMTDGLFHRVATHADVRGPLQALTARGYAFGQGQ